MDFRAMDHTDRLEEIVRLKDELIESEARNAALKLEVEALRRWRDGQLRWAADARKVLLEMAALLEEKTTSEQPAAVKTTHRVTTDL
jgi:hypothetical protein